MIERTCQLLFKVMPLETYVRDDPLPSALQVLDWGSGKHFIYDI